MKRKKETKGPCWHLIPMEKIEAVIHGWERLKSLRDEIKDQPEALGFLWASIDAQAAGEAALARQLEVIIPAATAEVSAWLADQSRETRCSGGDPAAVVMLWESYLALATLAPDQETRSRWLATKTREDRHLLTRLSKRLSLPTS